ncbi:V-set and transmembrane domain-containing protein 5 isoform X1 [Melanotaenia boesemani]|uniref:V-set and transmembrane domain-containing protein 5 isoform X1 n=1 Tax=Melanotaenia boesemani TaxID=1250792 RepID=UPI001C04D920|nr:V-set and transmembrane domain-containing protein 5 isoform X1 [Melanotaenia boesemani]XP_041851194.1 V-set and transmembrane domain-containing protein 5 isoform X1 [Melanotaenia boesemani]XP_041851195.1 V-set and transmembrane domain-containing protein 5 isoform X1 [Melanotaenia boesemani]XP_041851196.1 V-set and transmembrane domain-containing protein 5 isoform X1 [Melanotaenia boesemani]
MLMWHFRLCNVQDVAVFLSITLYLCHLAEAISIYSPQRSLTRSVQDDVMFSVEFNCSGIPTIQWTFMSGAVSRAIGTWQPGVYINITVDYSSRVRLYENGSMSLSHLRLQDGGFYVVTVTDSTGSSKDAGFVLKVNEVLYEDLQYLSVAAVALAFCAGLLMLAMWLLHKACRKIRARRRKKQMPENDATELQPL